MATYREQGTLSHVGYWKTPGGAVLPVYKWSLVPDLETLKSKLPSRGLDYYYLNTDFKVPLSSISSTLYGEFMAMSINIPKDSAIARYDVEWYNYLFYIYGNSSSVINTLYVGGYDSAGVELSPMEFDTKPYTTTDRYEINSNGRVGIMILVLDGPDGSNYYYRCTAQLFYTGSDGTSNISLAVDGYPRNNDWGTDFFGIKIFYSGNEPDFQGEFVPGTTPPIPNPYDPIDPSQPGGGGGTFDDSSDLIPDSSLPTLSSANTGFTRIYNPTLSQVQQLAQYLWTDETLIETLWNKVKQYFEDPMQAIIGFNLVPVPVPDAGTKNFALMYIDTGVSMNVAASQFVDRDCGTLKIEPYYGSALDYAPHTKISIFLPFIGTVQLNTDEVMGRTLQVKYRVDICSGSCVAKVAVDGNFIYQFSGHCAIPIPISSSDFSSYVGSAISVAKLGITAAVGAATGGAGLFASAAAQQTGNAVSTMTETTTARNPDTGRQITTGTRTVEVSTPVQSTGASFSGISPQNVSNTVGEIMASKPFVEHSGSFSGNTGYLGIRRPFLIIERPNLCLPENFQNYNGYPSMITLPLSECTGFTAVQQIHLEGVTATNPEQAEILELLKGGVIF